jgi:hypothetical protein
MVFRFLGSRRPSVDGNSGLSQSYPSLMGRATPREIALQAELDVLRAQQAALARKEREAAANLADLQDGLDRLAGEIDRRAKATRDHELRERGEKMIAKAKRLVRDGVAGRIPATTLMTMVRVFLGMERPERGSWLEAFMEESAAKSSQRPSSTHAAIQMSAAEIVAAGERARAGAPTPRPTDPVAREIVRAGRIARNEKPE